jgi:rhamnulose-1-phosphate aldolase
MGFMDDIKGVLRDTEDGLRQAGKDLQRALKDVKSAPFVKEMCKTTANMYRLGWDERNGGNISYLLNEKEVAEYLDLNKVLRTIPLAGVNAADFDVTPLIGKIFIVTGTGKYFKNVEDDPEANLGIVRVAQNGIELLWGYNDGGRTTSELPAHLMCHMARLKVDPENRVVMHSHPTHTLAMNYVHELDEKKLTHTLWEMCTECIAVFPDGVGILPWMLCGTDSIGVATAKKMEEFRLVIWAMHGIYGTGKTMDETFGLIETVEKAAQIYMLTAHLPRINTIKDEQMKELAELFKCNYRKDFLNLK